MFKVVQITDACRVTHVSVSVRVREKWGSHCLGDPASMHIEQMSQDETGDLSNIQERKRQRRERDREGEYKILSSFLLL